MQEGLLRGFWDSTWGALRRMLDKDRKNERVETLGMSASGASGTSMRARSLLDWWVSSISGGRKLGGRSDRELEIDWICVCLLSQLHWNVNHGTIMRMHLFGSCEALGKKIQIYRVSLL